MESESNTHLVPLSRSPSVSSLASEASFNPHAPPTDLPENGSVGQRTTSPPVLGVRELLQMAKTEKETRTIRALPPESPLALVQPVEIRLFGSTTHEDSPDGTASDGEYEGQTSDVPRYSETVPGLFRSSSEGPFAKEVEIRGWKVVGGRTWTGAARVGAYVVYDIHISLRSGGAADILRRYTEFVKLRAALMQRFPGFREAIPPLPGKNHASKFSPKFLADRQSRLTIFLRTIMLHPVMGRGGPDSVVGRRDLEHLEGHFTLDAPASVSSRPYA